MTPTTRRPGRGRPRTVLVAFLVVAGLAALPALATAPVVVLLVALANQGAGNPCLVTASPALMSTGGWRLPVTGPFTVTSDYGMRVHPVTGQRRLHAGIDLATTPHGGPIVAAKDGTVTAVTSSATGGNTIYLDHGQGVQTRYLHLSGVSVSLGDTVTAGQKIGTEGATGRVTGPHLHFEVRLGGQSTDPRPYLATQQVTIPADGRSGTAPPAGTPPVSGLAAGPAPAAVSGPPTSPLTGAGLPDRIGPYGPDQVRNAATIIAVGRERGLDEWTITVAVMTAIGESGLVNIDYGDSAHSTSRGLFQEIDAHGPVATRMDPAAAAARFYDRLTAVPGYHDLQPTIAAHKAQGNLIADHYTPSWPAAVEIVSVLLDDPNILAFAPAAGVAATCDPTTVAGDLPAPPGTCPATTSPAERGLRPYALAGLRCTHAVLPVTTMYGVGTRNGKSDHPAGNAVDYMIDNYKTPEGKAYGWRLAEWQITNAENQHVKYVIFDMKIRKAGETQWRPYTRYGSNPNDTLGHKDHIHVSYESS